MGLPQRKVRVALDYWAAYPDEIERQLRDADDAERAAEELCSGSGGCCRERAVAAGRDVLAPDRLGAGASRARRGRRGADPELAGLPGEQVLEWVTSQGRCLVTENVKDYELLRRAAAA
jgi:hypothetical protein